MSKSRGDLFHGKWKGGEEEGSEDALWKSASRPGFDPHACSLHAALDSKPALSPCVLVRGESKWKRHDGSMWGGQMREEEANAPHKRLKHSTLNQLNEVKSSDRLISSGTSREDCVRQNFKISKTDKPACCYPGLYDSSCQDDVNTQKVWNSRSQPLPLSVAQG